MKELNLCEVKHVSGGTYYGEGPFVLAIIAGINNWSYATTVQNYMLFNGVAGTVAFGAAFGPMGIIPGAILGAIGGYINALIGYSLGNMYADPVEGSVAVA